MTGWRIFFIVWAGQLVSLLGSALTGFALGAWIFQRTGSATQFAPDFQGRVFATRDMAALAALPLGLLITAPLAEFVLGPALRHGGALSSNLGSLIGMGEGRGIGLIFMLTGVVNVLIAALVWLNPRIRNVESEIPDAIA